MATKSEPAALGPVSVPAGSYDVTKLAKGLEGAAGKPEEDRPAAIEKAISDASAGTTTGTEPALIPGHAYIEVKSAHGTERRQVYVPPEDAAQPAPAPRRSGRRADPDKAAAAAVRSQIETARKEGEVAPPAAPDPAAGVTDPPADPPADAGTGTDQK